MAFTAVGRAYPKGQNNGAEKKEPFFVMAEFCHTLTIALLAFA